MTPPPPPPFKKGALTCILSSGRSALGLPVSHIHNQVTILLLKADAGRCAAVKQGLSRLGAFDVSIHHPWDKVYMCVCECVFLHPLLVWSPSMKTQPLCLPGVIAPKSSPTPLPQTQWTFLSDTCFNLFLLFAPPPSPVFFLPQYFLPMARPHATFTVSSLVLTHSLLHLLSCLFFTSFTLASLNCSFICLPLLCISFPSVLHFLQCHPSLTSFTFTSVPSLAFVAEQCLSMGRGWTPTPCCFMGNPTWLDVIAGQGSYN